MNAKITPPSLVLMAVVMLTLIGACGSEPIDPNNANNGNGTLFPLAVGNSWTYAVVDGSGSESTKVQEIVDTASVGGDAAFVFLTSRAKDRGTRSVQTVRDGQLWRISEETLEAGSVVNRYQFAPRALRMLLDTETLEARVEDTHDKNQVDASGNIIMTVTKAHVFEVEATDELVEVEAGTFECIRVRRSRAGHNDKTYWYALGVGKIKEEGGQTESLVRVHLE